MNKQSPTTMNHEFYWGYRNVGEGLLIGAEITQRQLHHKAHPNMYNSSQRSRTWSTVQSLQAAPLVRVSFPGDTVVLTLFQAASLYFFSGSWSGSNSVQLGLTEGDSAVFVAYSWSERHTANPVGFRDFLVPCVLRASLEDGMFQFQGNCCKSLLPNTIRKTMNTLLFYCALSFRSPYFISLFDFWDRVSLCTLG